MHVYSANPKNESDILSTRFQIPPGISVLCLPEPVFYAFKYLPEPVFHAFKYLPEPVFYAFKYLPEPVFYAFKYLPEPVFYLVLGEAVT